MATDRSKQRIDVLLGWRESTRDGPFDLPSEGDLVKIGAAGKCDIPYVDTAAVRPWKHTLDFLITQVNFGVHDPVEQMTDEMRSPVPEPTGPPGNGAATETDPVLNALLAWRQTTERTDPRVRGLKDHHLKAISRTGRRTSREIATHLPADVRRFAADLARIVGEVLDPTGDRVDVTRPDVRLPTDPDRPRAAENGRPGSGPTPDAAGRAPEATPGPTGPGPTDPHPPPPEVEDLASLRFVPFDFPSQPDPPGPIAVSFGTDGQPELRWDAAPGGWVVYRVVTSDRVVPFSPDVLDEADEIDVVAVTRGTMASDERPFTAALRHATVWRHSGADRAASLRTPPVLHAATSFVAPVVDVRIGEDEGRVVGRWTALPGTAAVRVVRVRTDRSGPHARAAGQHDVHADLGGFTDEAVEPGGTYRYLVQAAVRDEGQGEVLAQACVRTVTVTAVLDPVCDLEWREAGGDSRRLLDLVWTAPRLGQVEVYKTPASPTVGARGELLDESTLDSAGLPGSARQDNRRVPAGDGRTAMPGVSWPSGWTRVYLTPVTVHGGRARVGVTAVATRTESPRDPRIAERVDHQVLTFEWPEGAAAVEVHQGATGEGADTATAGEPVAQISREDYEGLGGLQFPWPLEARGCSLHLVAVSWSNTRVVPSTPVSLAYPGLLRIRYALTVRPAVRLGRKPRTVAVQLAADIPVPSPQFALVHNPRRLPLAVDDGTALYVTEEFGRRAGWRVQPDQLGPNGGGTWIAELPASGGWVRLFVDLAPHVMARIQAGEIAPVAVRDPHPGTLRFDDLNGRRP